MGHMRRIPLIIILTFHATLLAAQPGRNEQAVNSRPFVIGDIEEIQSKALNEKRILNIYLPEGYRDNDTT